MSATLTNGRQRKSLADQIERLDCIFDGLSDGLNEAVAAAVKEAVRAVLSEVLTNPELLARLHPVQPIAVPEPPRAERMAGPDLGRRSLRVPIHGRANRRLPGLGWAGVRQRLGKVGRWRPWAPRSVRAAVDCRRQYAAAHALAAGSDPGRGGPGRLDRRRGLPPGSVDGGERQRGRWAGNGAGKAHQRILVPLDLAVAGIGGMIGPFE